MEFPREKNNEKPLNFEKDFRGSFSISDLKDFVNSSSSYKKQLPTRMDDELAKREELRNKDLEQDIQLKKTTLDTLLNFLRIEIAVIFGFALFQATGFLNFRLEEWSFRMLIGATITQNYFMLRIAVEYLFPKNKK